MTVRGPLGVPLADRWEADTIGRAPVAVAPGECQRVAGGVSDGWGVRVLRDGTWGDSRLNITGRLALRRDDSWA